MTDVVPFAVPNVTEEDIHAVADVMRSRWLTTGEVAAELEAALSVELGGLSVRVVASCTHALEIALRFLDLPAGARVGVPTWTFVSTALAGVHAGLTPVLLDIDYDTLNLSASSLEAAAADLDAVIPVHMGGVPVDEAVFDVADAHGLAVIEDAAHSLGSVRPTGETVHPSSVAACYSFYATKNLTSAEGGAIATTNPSLAEFTESFRLHGLTRDAWSRYRPGSMPEYDLVGPGIKANMPDMIAAMACSQLSRFHSLQEARRNHVLHYRERLSEIDGVEPVPGELRANGADHLMVVRLDESIDRANVIRSMDEAGVGSSVHFRPLHTFGWMQKHAVMGPSGHSVADQCSTRVMSLPLYPDLSEGQIDRVCDLLGAVISET